MSELIQLAQDVLNARSNIDVNVTDSEKENSEATHDDLLSVAKSAEISKPAEIIQEVLDAVSMWPTLAQKAGVGQKMINQVTPLLINEPFN